MSRRYDHRTRRRRRGPPGAAPGSLHIDAREPEPVVRVLRYGPEGVSEDRELPVAKVSSLRVTQQVLWVSVVGLGDAQALEAVASKFGIHRLTLEDVVNTHQRPKVERFPGYDAIVLRTPRAGGPLVLEQLTIVVGNGFAVSFEEGSGLDLEPVRERIRSGAGIIRRGGSDFLAYALIDLAIDRYFPLLDDYADRIEAIEAQVLQDASASTLTDLYAIKEELRECRRSIWPVRDVIGALMRDDHAHFSEDARLHIRDCFDHVVQLMDLIESDRDTATGLMELHVSNVGNRMNEVMKVLTIIATIFMPLSFIAGLYGMNFDTTASPWNMPELHWRWGYPGALGVMAAVALGMLAYFRRKGWL